MKKLIFLVIIFQVISFAGRLGIGIGGSAEYNENYALQNYGELKRMYYSAEFRISAEALPYMFIEPIGIVVNDAFKNTVVPGIGLRINVAPRLGKFFLAPFFGIEGDILFYNPEMSLRESFSNNRLEEYFEGSSPRAAGMGFGGLSIYFGKSASLDCQYRYLCLAKGIGIEMVGASLTYYINW